MTDISSHGKIPCSVLILTRNSAETLDRCLQNLSPFAEILVHDANSGDDSVAIAKRYGAKVLKQYDTDEKSVRVKDFTEIRLRQRADAQCDWVLYLDSDEYLSDELVSEIAHIIKDAHRKMVIKVPRLPVIDGIVRTHGILYPEVMPRIHHRLGGCTLQLGKVVHEKYIYDATFTEVMTRAPLLFPLEDVSALRSKDDRYITLEVQRIRSEGYSWWHYLRWFLLREPLIMAWLSLCILLNILRYRHETKVPLAHEWRYVSYHWRLYRAVTGAMLACPFTSGKQK